MDSIFADILVPLLLHISDNTCKWNSVFAKCQGFEIYRKFTIYEKKLQIKKIIKETKWVWLTPVNEKKSKILE